VEQGSFQDLQRIPGYVDTLVIQDKEKQKSTHVQENEYSIPRQSEGTQEDQTNDDTRRLGDLSVYKYYTRYTGFAYLFIFLGMQFIKVSFYSVPGNS